MDFLIETLFETDWGIIILGFILLVGLIVEIMNNKPKI